MSSGFVDSYLDELLAPLAEAAMEVATVATVETDVTRVAAPVAKPAPPPAPAPVEAPRAAPEPPAPSPAPRYQAAEAPPRPNQGGGTTGRSRWLRAMLGRDRYAFELLRVQEVVRTAPIIALRGTSSAMLGVMNLRGRVVPVFDLARWLGTGHVTVDEQSRIIVVERDDELIGVLVSAVDDVATLAREQIEPPLPGSDPGGVLGIARVSHAPTVLLDANALFA